MLGYSARVEGGRVAHVTGWTAAAASARGGPAEAARSPRAQAPPPGRT